MSDASQFTGTRCNPWPWQVRFRRWLHQFGWGGWIFAYRSKDRSWHLRIGKRTLHVKAAVTAADEFCIDPGQWWNL